MEIVISDADLNFKRGIILFDPLSSLQMSSNLSDTFFVTFFTDYETVPTTYVEPRQYTATVGDASFQIQCLVTATPGATSWYWTFQPVGGSQQTIAQGTNDNQYIVDNSGTNPYLTVKSIALNEAGIYTCYATNSAGTSDGANNPSSRHTLTVTGAVPTTNVEPRQYTATVGDASFQIHCLVTATPGASSWYWTFQPVGGSQQTIAQGTNDNQYTVDNSGTNPYLTIKSITLNEAGIYTCYATNSAGTSDGANNPSSRHTLTVTGGGLDITVSRSTYSAIAGDSIVTILCNINGTPPAIAWDWTKTSITGGNSEIISQGTNNARRQVVSSATKPNLNIYSITENDEGIYRCRASNGKQQYISDPITLKVQEASLRKVPGEPQTKSALEVKEGRTVMLTCSSTGGNPAPSVVWLKDGLLISTGSNSSIVGNVTTTTLTFVTTSHDNLEVYECQADNDFLQRPLVKTTYLHFSPSNKPPGQPIITGSQRYDLGDTVTLSCSSTGGNPIPTVNWLRDDNVITTGISRFSGSEVTRITLTFVAGLEDHLEVFECQAHNDYLQNPLASTTYIELYFAPRVPTLTGPSTLISGSSGKWTCSSANGYPAPTLSMRIQDRQYTNEITVLQSYDIIDKSYTVAGTLNLVPSIDKTGQDLCCDVIYLFGNNDPQSTCLQLTINDEDEDNIIIYVVIGILAMLVLFVVLLVVMIRYRIGREKGKDNSNSKYVSQQAAISNQQDTTDNSTHRDRDRDNEGLDSNRREMHVYNTSQDNVEYSHYSTIPADHVFVDPNHTHPSILKQNSTNLQQDTTYLEPEHYILLTLDNVYLEPDQTYFQPISGNSMTSTT
ncbi:Hypothetical predicted protein [Mytilus galloprovincialis]|uniref:Ig-like domain-containing protein n=1 Tax=Mytilus galloprovincialis TaxID=29158 RepID=A0A8B6G2Z3_MYTGA|nr:Hypothetical predicted protein [Mytilus galloprovincialis]